MTSRYPRLKTDSASYGVGIGLRHQLLDETLAARDDIDWLEIVVENYMGQGGHSMDVLRQAMDAGFPVIPHGVALSIGSVDPLDETYLDALEALFQVIQPPWFSDHLCFSSVDNIHLHDLLPMPFTWEAVHHVVKRIKAVEARIGLPFLIENISYYTPFPGELTEAQFIAEILERADCGMLLDVNNVYVNSQNHQEDALAFIDQMPMDRVVQLHIAGHHKAEHMIVDTHGDTICREVYELLEVVLDKTTTNGILLERDQNLPDMDELLAEVHEIRAITQRHTTPKAGVAV